MSDSGPSPFSAPVPTGAGCERFVPRQGIGEDSAAPAPVRVESAVLNAISEAAAAAYPFEGCGALLGRTGEQSRLVSLTLPLPNREEGRPRVRFEVSPRDYMSVEDEADRLGLTLLGFWHTHPDHPAIPSATDRAFAWQGLLTVIVSVPDRQPGPVTAWEILGLEAPFTPVHLVESELGRPVTTLAGCHHQEKED